MIPLRWVWEFIADILTEYHYYVLYHNHHRGMYCHIYVKFLQMVMLSNNKTINVVADCSSNCATDSNQCNVHLQIHSDRLDNSLDSWQSCYALVFSQHVHYGERCLFHAYMQYFNIKWVHKLTEDTVRPYNKEFSSYMTLDCQTNSLAFCDDHYIAYSHHCSSLSLVLNYFSLRKLCSTWCQCQIL